MSQFQRWNAPSVTERIVRVCVCVWTIDRTLRLSNSNNITTTLSWRSKSEKKIKPRREREREGERRRKKERADAVDIIIPWMQPLCRLGLCLCVSRTEPRRESRALCRTRKNAKGGDKKSPLYNSAHGPRMTELKSKKMALLEEEEEEELRCLASFSYSLILFGQ